MPREKNPFFFNAKRKKKKSHSLTPAHLSVKNYYIVPSKSFIWVTSKYLGSCWSYRKTKATLLYQTTHSAFNEPSFRSLGETFVK